MRVIGSTVVLFLVILAFLVGRVRAGADPGLARETTRATQSAPPATGVDPQSGSANDPQSGVSPGAGDNFGNAVPGSAGSTGGGTDPGFEQGGNAPRQLDPPSTHVS